MSETQEKSTSEDGGMDTLTDEQSVYAVLSMDNFMLLRTENDYSISVLQQLETAACLLSQQVLYSQSINQSSFNYACQTHM